MVFALVAASAQAQTQTGFDDWLVQFRQDALQQGISEATLDAAFVGAQPVERVVELDRRQPEFLQTFSDYLVRRATPTQVARGQTVLDEHAALFDSLEARYGVPRAVLAAFWGLETRYGAFQGSFNIPVSLATLAYDGRRSEFFRSQLLDALRIIDAGHVDAASMNGSWAGAMGHMQFMPSTFRAYAVDGDGDDRIDLWGSVPDAMTSAANYLRRAGWQPGQPIALEVQLPPDFDWRKARVANRMPLAQWKALGVRRAEGCALPDLPGRAAVVLPQGWQGPALLVFDNFDVVMQWNRSQNYALTVAQLAGQISGLDGLQLPAGETGALSVEQVKTLQQSLNLLGFDVGVPDGLLGPMTQSAVRRYQVVHALPADGHPSPSLVAHVEQSLARAEGERQLTLAPNDADALGERP